MKRIWTTLLVFTVLVAGQSLRADERTISALGPWQAEGKVYKVGPNENQFIGVFKGIMYAENEEWQLDTAFFVCPVTHVHNVEANTTEANARCHIVAAGGNVYGRFQCTGNPGHCDGRFEIVGGTDEFEGITGESSMRVRMALSARMSDPASGDVVSQAEGLAIWPDLTYSIPKKSE